MTMPALDPALCVTLRAALAILFVWAAGHKLRDLTGFRQALADYEILPRRWVAPSSLILIAAELAVACGLWLPRFGAAAALVAAGLLALYAGAIVINLRRGRRDIDCGCIGAARYQSLSTGLVVRNGVLVATALASILPATARALIWIDAITIGAGVTASVLLYAAVDGLFAHAPQIAALQRTGVPLDTPPKEGGYSGRTVLILICHAFFRSSRVGPIFSGAVSRDRLRKVTSSGRRGTYSQVTHV